jgi:subtilisin family serine protease
MREEKSAPNGLWQSSISGTRGRTKKRRPAGVSRSQKRRHLQFESLESRQMMSATPVSYDFSYTDVVMRDLLMDAQAISSLSKASDLSQYTEAELAATTQWVVFTELGTNLSSYEAAGGFTVYSVTDIVPGSFIIDVPSGTTDQLVSALSGHEEIDFFYPLVSTDVEELAVTNDPYLEKQWHLINFGQEVGNPNFGFLYGTVDEDINIENAWDYYSGEGVVIGIVDSGVQTSHPDLVDNLRLDLGIDLVNGGSPDPSGDDAHGTATAGLAAGVGDNGVGTTGVAYNAGIAPIRLFSDDPLNPSGLTDLQIAQAFLHEFQEIDVYNHSWGIPPAVNDQGEVTDPRAIIELGPLAGLALRNSVFFGRGGLGSIHVFAAGNSSGIRDTGNYSETVNSRYTISVGGVIEDGTAASYAEAGAAILVVAPTGSNPETIIRDDELGAGIVTTDMTGNSGFNEAPVGTGVELDADYFTDTDYTSRFNGTSAAAPIVTGVIALMLEANPNLTYRDVQHILVRSARQNAPDDASWITNVNQFFLDPLAFDSNTEDTVYDGTWPFPVVGNPDAEVPVPDKFVYYQVLRTPYLFTNGAGYTVSQLTTNTEYGYAHGVVDAAMAVELAKNWVTVGGQQSEYTWTTGPTAAPTLPAAAISNEATGEFRVPGGISPRGDGDVEKPNPFIDFLNEFGKEDDPALPNEETPDPEGPFTGDDVPISNRDFGAIFSGLSGIPLTPPPMTVEWVEVQLNIQGDEEAIDFLRISLISPDGTVSELKSFEVPNINNPWQEDILFDAHGDPAGVLSPGSGGLTAVFTTNRHWGERTEGKPRLNSDGTPVLAFNPDTGLYDGDPVVDGWRLVFENFSDTELDIGSFEVAFHGSNAVGTGRIQGAVGVDDNGDGFYSDSTGTASNFTRYLETERIDPGEDGELGTDDDRDFRYFGDGSIQYDRMLNFGQESWAAGVIVYADANQNGVRDLTDPTYQVGADGNYYFDLVPGDYDIRIDPNSLEAAGLYNQVNLDAVSAVLATATISAAGERVLATPVDYEGETTITAIYGFDFGTTSSVPELNIMLTPNSVAEEIYNIGGYVYGDLDANGQRDGNDINLAGASVFIDVNQDAVFSPGVDLLTTTDPSGRYDFDEISIPTGYYRVIVLEGSTGTFSEPLNPDDASREFFFDPSPEPDNFPTVGVVVSIDPLTGVATYETNFGFVPGTGGGGGSTGGVAISGVVFADDNNTGARESFESGLSGSVAKVYVDINGNNQLDAGEPNIEPGSNGSFVFNSLAAGSYAVRIQFDTVQYTQTTPSGQLKLDGTRLDENDWEYSVNLTVGQVASGLMFGLKNNAVYDWGDLPSNYYLTTAAQNGPRHLVLGNLFLGSSVDTELSPVANANATGDDTTGIDDENGIVFSELRSDSTTITLTITANTNGGWLQGWIDWNEDHVFDASERVFTDQLLPAGQSVFVKNVPTAVLTTGTVYARFRYGEEGINSITGVAQRGEVEDYAIPVVSAAIDPGLQIVHGPDFDDDGDVDGFDFLSWQRGFGATSGATASMGDANSDGKVSGVDLTFWKADYGAVSTLVEHGPDFNESGDVDGLDFLSWQRGFGITNGASASQGDANSDGRVNASDFALWQQEYAGGAPQVAAITVGAADSGLTLPAPALPSTLTVDSIPVDPMVDSFVSSPALMVSARASTTTAPSSEEVTAVVSEVERSLHRVRKDGAHRGSRLESRQVDQVFEDSNRLVEAGVALRRENEHRHATSRSHRFEVEQWDTEADDNSDPLALAFADVAQWKQF